MVDCLTPYSAQANRHCHLDIECLRLEDMRDTEYTKDGKQSDCCTQQLRDLDFVSTRTVQHLIYTSLLSLDLHYTPA